MRCSLFHRYDVVECKRTDQAFADLLLHGAAQRFPVEQQLLAVEYGELADFAHTVGFVIDDHQLAVLLKGEVNSALHDDLVAAVGIILVHQRGTDLDGEALLAVDPRRRCHAVKERCLQQLGQGVAVDQLRLCVAEGALCEQPRDLGVDVLTRFFKIAVLQEEVVCRAALDRRAAVAAEKAGLGDDALKIVAACLMRDL